jgi:regulator of protease activity HflC (stomatin/prohibitin superfamily)
MIVALLVVLACILGTALVLASASVRVLREYERGVVFRLGRVMPQRGPGLIFLLPWLDRMVRVSLRTVTLQIPAQEIITRDNVPARVTAVTYYRVIDSTKSVIEIENVKSATSQIAQTTLRSVLGKADLDGLLAERERLNEHLQQIIDDQTEPWGIKVTAVEIKDVEIPDRMQHAIARQAEAERERRGKIINAEGEFQAAARLSDAADLISRNPVTIQLRYLQTLIEVSNNQSSTIVFPIPMDILRPLVAAAKDHAVTNGDRDDDGEHERLDAALAASRVALAAATEGAQLQIEDQQPAQTSEPQRLQAGTPAPKGPRRKPAPKDERPTEAV